MGDYNNELAWKNDNPFFVSLNKNLEELRASLINANRDMNNILDFYNQVVVFKIMYTPYMKFDEEKLKEISKTILSQEVTVFFAQKKKSPEIYTKVIEALQSLNSLSQDMINQLSINGVLPKINQKKKYDPKKAIQNETY